MHTHLRSNRSTKIASEQYRTKDRCAWNKKQHEADEFDDPDRWHRIDRVAQLRRRFDHRCDHHNMDRAVEDEK